MYIATIAILIFLICTTAEGSWKYIHLANTTDGFPCMAECTKNRCIADWDGNTKECWTSKHPSPKFRTAEVHDKSSKYCLSNCDYFGWNYQWCVTTNQKGWDYCNIGRDSVSIYGKSCTGECQKGSTDYYWCQVENGIDWQFCALPREDVEENDSKEKKTEEKKVDTESDEGKPTQ